MSSRPSTPTPPSIGSPTPSSAGTAGITSPSSSTAAATALHIEEREKRLAEERIQQALRLQRKQRLEQLIHKRKANLEYLKKLHQGGVLWLNVTLFTYQDIRHYVRTMVPKQRVESFFLLGMSVSTMLVLNPGLSTVRAFAQLIEEWEYYHAGTAMQSMKYVMAKNSPCIYPHTAVATDNTTDLLRPNVHKFNNTVVYEYLQVIHIAYELDYVEVLLALCDVLFKLYEKLFHSDCFT